MNKILGIFGLLVFLCLFTTVLSSNFDSAANLYNVTRWSALYGIISIGVAFVIITGGIDLSIGSMVCLIGCLLPTFIVRYEWSIPLSIVLVLALSLVLGLFHGLLITKLKLQPFVVTLFGFLVYRGFARWFCEDQPMGFGRAHDDGLRQLATGQPWKGHENNLALLAGIVGALLLVFFVSRLFWKAESRRESMIGAGLALLAAVAGLSQFIGDGTPMVMTLAGGYKFELEPASLFFHFGLMLFVPLSLAFLVAGIGSDAKQNWLPILALAIATPFFCYVAYAIAPIFETLSPGGDDPRDFGFVTLSEGSLRNLIMSFVFVATGAFMASIGWVANKVQRTSAFGKTLLLPVIVSGVMWLFGMTELPKTLIPMPLLILIGCAIVASIFLNQSIYGRYLLALGRNEEAARYSGIDTDRMKIMAYMICSLMSGIGAILFALDINNIQPATHGNVYELWAIGGAVLGGCSLFGGEGTIGGVIIGAAVMRVIYNSINTLRIDTKLEFVALGVVILAGVIADEVVKRMVAAKRAKQTAE